VLYAVSGTYEREAMAGADVERCRSRPGSSTGCVEAEERSVLIMSSQVSEKD
jgi:hypothetical protein